MLILKLFCYLCHRLILMLFLSLSKADPHSFLVSVKGCSLCCSFVCYRFIPILSLSLSKADPCAVLCQRLLPMPFLSLSEADPRSVLVFVTDWSPNCSLLWTTPSMMQSCLWPRMSLILFCTPSCMSSPWSRHPWCRDWCHPTILMCCRKWCPQWKALCHALSRCWCTRCWCPHHALWLWVACFSDNSCSFQSLFMTGSLWVILAILSAKKGEM